MAHVVVNQIQLIVGIQLKRNPPRALDTVLRELCSRCINHQPQKHMPLWAMLGAHLPPTLRPRVLGEQ